MVQMNAIIEIQVGPFYYVRLKRGRHGDIHIDQVEVTHLLRDMPDVIPPALEIDFKEAICAFKPSAFPMVPITQPRWGKEADHLVRFGVQIRLVFVAQGPVILLGYYLNFSHLFGVDQRTETDRWRQRCNISCATSIGCCRVVSTSQS